MSREEAEALINDLKFETLKDRLTKNHTRAVTVVDDNTPTMEKDNIVILRWKQWGRTSKNCHGFGLCEAVWFPSSLVDGNHIDEINNGATLIERNNNGNLYADILLAEPISKEIAAQLPTLEVDEDLATPATTRSTTEYCVQKGSYQFDTNLGENGGYRIVIK